MLSLLKISGQSLKARFGGNDERPSFIPVAGDLEEEICAGLGDGKKSDIIQHSGRHYMWQCPLIGHILPVRSNLRFTIQ